MTTPAQARLPFRPPRKPRSFKVDACEARRVATARLILSDPLKFQAPEGSLLRQCAEMVLAEAEQPRPAEDVA